MGPENRMNCSPVAGHLHHRPAECLEYRHEATSRFFEKGLNPIEVATITGHKDTKMLMRYTHLRAEDLVGRLG